MKKSLLYILSFIFIFSSFADSSVSLEDLIDSALLNNSDIRNSQYEYKSNDYLYKSLNGYFLPSVGLSASSSVDSTFNKVPDNYTYGLNIKQNLTGCSYLSINTSYAMKTFKEDETDYISQYPSVSLSYTQSLLPFYMQFKFRDPYICSLRLNQRYYQQNVEYQELTVIQNVCRYYIEALITQKQLQIYINLADNLRKQEESLNELFEKGEINYSRIMETELSRLSYEQYIAEYSSSFNQYVGSLKKMTGLDFDELFLENNIPLLDELFLNYPVLNKTDVYLEMLQSQLDMADNQKTENLENCVPSVSFNVTPSLSLEDVKTKEWYKAFDKSIKDWTFGVSLDLSPLANCGTSQSLHVQENRIKECRTNIKSYIEQNEIEKAGYIKIRDVYKEKYEDIKNMYEKQQKQLSDLKILYNQGRVSELDYLESCCQTENCGLYKDIFFLNLWITDFMARRYEKQQTVNALK